MQRFIHRDRTIRHVDAISMDLRNIFSSFSMHFRVEKFASKIASIILFRLEAITDWKRLSKAKQGCSSKIGVFDATPLPFQVNDAKMRRKLKFSPV